MCADACCKQTTGLQWALLRQPTVHRAVGSKQCCQVVRAVFQRGYIARREGKLAYVKGQHCFTWSVWNVSWLVWFFFFLPIQSCREREGNHQSAKRARLSEKCFWATEEEEQRKETLPPFSLQKRKRQPSPKPSCTTLLSMPRVLC